MNSRAVMLSLSLRRRSGFRRLARSHPRAFLFKTALQVADAGTRARP
jgi:hypothetical protein